MKCIAKINQYLQYCDTAALIRILILIIISKQFLRVQLDISVHALLFCMVSCSLTTLCFSDLYFLPLYSDG